MQSFKVSQGILMISWPFTFIFGIQNIHVTFPAMTVAADNDIVFLGTTWARFVKLSISTYELTVQWHLNLVCFSFRVDWLCFKSCLVRVFFSPFSISITLLGEEKVNQCFLYICSICACLVLTVFFPFSIWAGLRLVIVALPGISS